MGDQESSRPKRGNDSAVTTQVWLTAVIGLLATSRGLLPASALRHADHGTGMVPGIHQGGRGAGHIAVDGQVSGPSLTRRTGR